MAAHVDGEPIHRRTFHKAWTAAREKAELPDQIPHDMHRSAVRNLERAGIPRKVAMQKVGHSTESIYRRYHIVAELDIHEADLAKKCRGRGSNPHGLFRTQDFKSVRGRSWDHAESFENSRELVV